MGKSRNQKILTGRGVVDNIIQANSLEQVAINSNLLETLWQYTNHSDRKIREEVLAYTASNLSRCPHLLDIVLEGAAHHNIRTKDNLINALKDCDSSNIRQELERIMNSSNLQMGKRNVAAIVLGKEKPSDILNHKLAEELERNRPDPPDRTLEKYCNSPGEDTLNSILNDISKFDTHIWKNALEAYVHKEDPRILPVIRKLLKGNFGMSIQEIAAKVAGEFRDHACIRELLTIAISPYEAEPPLNVNWLNYMQRARSFEDKLEQMACLHVSALNALSEIGDTSVIELLETHLKAFWTKHGTSGKWYTVGCSEASQLIIDDRHIRIVEQLAMTLSILGDKKILDLLYEIKKHLVSSQVDSAIKHLRNI